jgi:saccharopine dehydrogenase-like NADP-dependent oxidoreductase
VEADFLDPAGISRLVGNYDAVVAAVPTSATLRILRTAVHLGVHYLDLSDDVDVSQLPQLDNCRSAVIRQCGLFPGLVSSLIVDLASQGSSNSDLEINIGILPRTSENRLGYGIVWDVDGLLREYTRPAAGIQDGVLMDLPALSAERRIHIEGRDYEAFLSGGVTSSMRGYFTGKVRSLWSRTMRYPGHLDYIRFLMDDLKLRTRPDILRQLLSNGLPEVTRDRVVLHLTATDLESGVETRRTYTKHLVSSDSDDMTILQRAAASHVAAVLDLLRQGILPDRGVTIQEEIPLASLKQNAFMSWFF